MLISQSLCNSFFTCKSTTGTTIILFLSFEWNKKIIIKLSMVSELVTSSEGNIPFYQCAQCGNYLNEDSSKELLGSVIDIHP